MITPFANPETNPVTSSVTNPVAIPVFDDNYIWLAGANTPQTGVTQANTDVIIIDPGTAEPVIRYLQQNQLQPCAILITHHHWDHIDGIQGLCQHYKDLPVYGPANRATPAIDYPLQDGDEITLSNGLSFRVIATPGHTLDHLCYYQPGTLFCGDTLFAAGCGRLFEGKAEQMYTSLSQLAELPADTRLYCTHEYTLSNLIFAQLIEPDNNDIKDRLARVRQLRAAGHNTLPSTLAEEHRSNPYLRCTDPDVIAAASNFAQRPVLPGADTFKVIRFWKDSWQG